MKSRTLQSRREFCTGASAYCLIAILGGLEFAFAKKREKKAIATLDVAAIDRARILNAAERYLQESPITVTPSTSSRSAGGRHDYFSEGDYWWPDLKNPGGPYIQRDGMSNPENFNDHRRALMRLSLQVPALAAAWLLTHDERYATHAASHLRAWFLDESTLMNPNLQYAQAIHGRVTGRGTGIIDTIHLVEVARAITVMNGSRALSSKEREGLKQWFAEYLNWMTSHPYGKEERDAKNNHGTCWVMQVAEFARLTGNQELTTYCRTRFKTVLLPTQVAADGSFPLELKRNERSHTAIRYSISTPWPRSARSSRHLKIICLAMSSPTAGA